MRIVIEIDGRELDVATAHPSAVTITFPQAPAAPPAPGVPQVVPGEVAEQELAADDAGPAPVGGLPLGEPAAFIAPIVPAAAETEAEATDAGPAPMEGLPPGEPVSFIPTTEPAAPGAEPEADDAGPAPTEGLAVDEPLAFIPTTEPAAPGAEAEATDAGPAPTEGLPSDEPFSPVPAATPDVLVAEPPVTDAGAAPDALIEEAGLDAAMMEQGVGGAPAAEAAPDDLTLIDGIGPKISGVLAQAGITLYAQLAACDVDDLQQLLVDAGVVAKVDTWPEQADVAVSGDLEALRAMQAKLKEDR